jgi:hypothetical protein
MKRTPLKSRSKKEGARLRRYQQARGIVYERSGGSCEARTPDCRGVCEQVHHRQGRDGDLIDNLNLLLGVCWACHNYIHGHPEVAYTNGWLVRRNGETV